MNNKKTEKRLLDINECASYLGVSKYIIYCWINMITAH